MQYVKGFIRTVTFNPEQSIRYDYHLYFTDKETEVISYIHPLRSHPKLGFGPRLLDVGVLGLDSSLNH